MKAKKHDWMMLLLVLPFALFGAVVLWIGAKDVEEQKREQVNIDSIRRIQKELFLKTTEDSVHFYEDGL